MAEKKPEGEGDAPPPKKKKLLLMIIIGVLVLVIGGGGAAFVLMKKKSHADEEEGDEAPAKVEKAKKPAKGKDVPPVFVKLDPVTVRLQADQGDSYLQTTIEMRVYDAAVGERVKQFMPEIRHKTQLALMGKKAAELGTPEGVQKLSNELRQTINVILDGPKVKPKKGKGKAKEEEPEEVPEEASADDSVQSVLFTTFIIQ